MYNCCISGVDDRNIHVIMLQGQFATRVGFMAYLQFYFSGKSFIETIRKV